MIIAPTTNVKILKNVPLENTYDHTLYFANATAQYNYFASKVAKNCVNYTYQRVHKGMIRIDGKADLYYDCNYMMFQNTSFGNKWFYAFINSVEYVNNETTEIIFEIDVIQTWLFDAHVEECFVDRQHSLSDAIGDNIVPETLPLGEYVFNSYQPISSTYADMCVVVAIVDTTERSFGQLYDGIYGGARLYAYDSTDENFVSDINSKLDEYLQKPDAVLSMYTVPKAIMPPIPASHILPYASSGATARYGGLTWKVSKTDTIDGYLPKNAKMYTYPYNYLHVDNSNGESLSLRYEFFENQTPYLTIIGNITQPVTLILRPSKYKGIPNEQFDSYATLNTESLQLSNYPLCSWNVDAYQAWVAQNTIPVLGGIIGGIAGAGVASNYSANPQGMLGNSIISNVMGAITANYTASIQADICKGSINGGSVNVSRRKQQFYYGRASVNRQYAKIIDDYFTMFGYAVKSIARINTHARPHWSYVKTIGCVLSGSVPSDDTKKIISVYDKGITFWMNANEVGNYELDNSLSPT